MASNQVQDEEESVVEEGEVQPLINSWKEWFEILNQVDEFLVSKDEFELSEDLQHFIAKVNQEEASTFCPVQFDRFFCISPIN